MSSKALLLAFLLASSGCYVSGKAVPRDDSPTISCQFVGSGVIEDEYSCLLTLRNPAGVEFESIPGEHSAGFGDADVQSVLAFYTESPIIPAVICRQFTNLEVIYFTNGEVDTLTPAAFADCTNLRQVLVQGHQIAAVPGKVFGSSPLLTVVDLSHNRISQIDEFAFAGTAVEVMELGFNEISAADWHWFTPIIPTMVFLDLIGNRITDIGAGAFSPLTSLTELNLAYNDIHTIHGSAFSGLVNLEILSLSSTQLTALNHEWFATLSALRTFSATNSRIAALPDGIFAPLVNLSNLYLYGNRIRDITAAAFGDGARNLRTVYFSDNMINNVDPWWLENAANLEYLLMTGNLCVDRDFLNVPETRWRIYEELLQCTDNFLMEPWIHCEYGDQPGGEYVCSLTTHNPNSRNDFDAIDGTHVAGRNNDDVTVLTVNYQNTRIFPSVICQSFANLRTIFVFSSNVEDLTEDSFADCANLEVLYLHGNRINGVPDFTFRNNARLRQLDIGMNWIETLSADSFTGSALAHIDIDANRLTEFNQAWFASVNATLETLDIVANAIISLDDDAFSNLGGLRNLLLGGNPLTTIPDTTFRALTNLQVLTLDHIGLSALNPAWFASLVSLERLYVQFNQLRELPDGIFAALTSLQRLTFNDNWLLELSGASFGPALATITHLDGRRNRLRSFDPSILDEAASLQWLLLGGNICNGEDFANVQGQLEHVRTRLGGCFANFGADAISCQFSGDQTLYACSMTVHNPLGRNNFERIEGTHLSGLGDADVTTVYVFSGVTLNIPSVICQQFSNVDEIDFMGNSIEYVEADSFAQCGNLRSLMIYNNLISEIPFGIFDHNPALNYVSFANNRLGPFSIPSDTFVGTAVSFLDLSQNNLEFFNPYWVQPLRSTLRTLDIFATGVAFLPADAFDGLDGLEMLVLSNNPLSELPADVFASLGSLTFLGLGDCQFRVVDPRWFAPLARLSTLQLHENRILDLPAGAFASLANLTSLFVYGNALRELNVETFGAAALDSVVYILAQSNQITAVDPALLGAARNLDVLYLSGNVCTQENFFDVQANREQIDADLRQCHENFAGESMNCNYMWNADNHYACMMEIFNPLGRDAWARVDGTHLPGQNDSSVWQVDILFQNTRIIPAAVCEQFSQLRELLVFGSELNVLSETSFAGCTELTHLIMFDNTLFEIPDDVFRNNPNLVFLEIGLNRFERFSERSFAGTAIEFLDISSNYLAEFDPRWFAPINGSLRTLDLLSNRIRSIPADAFRQLRDLRTLVLNNNPLAADAPLPPNTFDALDSLEALFLSNTSLGALNAQWLRGLRNLRTLQLNHNGIERLPDGVFANLRALHTLQLADNFIWEISTAQFGAAMDTLEVVDLRDNVVNMLDALFVTQTERLDQLLLAGNVCLNRNLFNVAGYLWVALEYLYVCTSNAFAESDVSCRYEDMPGAQYTCHLEAFNPRGVDDFATIPGEHVSGQGDDSVLRVAATQQEMRTFPSAVCRQFSNLVEIFVYRSNLLEVSPLTFSACRNLRAVLINGNLLRLLPGALLVNSPSLEFVSFGGNRIEEVAPNAFVGTSLNFIDLGFNRLASIEPATLNVVSGSLRTLDIIGNRLRGFAMGTFDQLGALTRLFLDRNPLVELDSTAFVGLASLEVLSLAHCQLGVLDPVLTFNLVNVQSIYLQDNQLEDIPDGMFHNMTRLQTVYIYDNDIRHLRGPQFGNSLMTLRVLRATSNEINSIDPLLLSNASSIDRLLLAGNLCADQDFWDVKNNLEQVKQQLDSCFQNFLLDPFMICDYVVTDSDEYSCSLQTHNPDGVSTGIFDDVPGDHLPGRNDDDVQLISMVNQNSRILPSVLCRTFANVHEILIMFSNVEIITASTFRACTNLEVLYINGNRLRTVPAFALSNSPLLHTVGLGSNRIRELNANSFAGTAIRFLDLAENLLRTFSIGWLAPINDTLHTLDLLANSITGVGSDAFRQLRGIEVLVLNNNHLTTIAADAFVSLESLRILALGHCNIRDINPAWFAPLATLNRLYLFENRLETLEGGAFNGLTSLDFLDLTGNSLAKIGINSFGNSLATLTSLQLRNNAIEAFDERILDAATELEMLFMQGNGCVDENFSDVRDNREEVRAALDSCLANFIANARMNCDYIVTANDEYACSLSIHNPEGLSTGIFDSVPGQHLSGRGDDDVLLVSMLFQNSRIFPSVICRTFPNVHEILIMWSHLDMISDSTFRACTNLEVLYLSSNELALIPPNVLSNSPRLHTLALGDNRISELSANSFAGTALQMLDLGQNRLSAVDAAWFAPLNATLTSLDLVANALSAIYSDSFRELRHLRAINLNNNNIGEIAADAFATLADLEILALGNNRLAEVEPQWFAALARLTRLYLFGNRLSAVPINAFNDLASLEFLELDHNNLSTLHMANLGAAVQTIVSLHMRFNAVNSLHPGLLPGSPNLNFLFLEGNICVDENFVQVRQRIEEVRVGLQTCFANIQPLP